MGKAPSRCPAARTSPGSTSSEFRLGRATSLPKTMRPTRPPALARWRRDLPEKRRHDGARPSLHANITRPLSGGTCSRVNLPVASERVVKPAVKQSHPTRQLPGKPAAVPISTVRHACARFPRSVPTLATGSRATRSIETTRAAQAVRSTATTVCAPGFGSNENAPCSSVRRR